MTELPKSAFDYWTLRFFRDSAAITTFVVGPIYQILETRSLPVFLLVSLLMLFLGHALTRFSYVRSSIATIRSLGAEHPRELKWFLLSITCLFLWMFIALIWSPEPALGARDTFALLFTIFLAPLFAVEFSKVAIIRFSTLLLIGFSVSTALVALELTDVLALQQYGDEDGEKYDLNRNASLAILLIWPVLYGFISRQMPRYLMVIPIVTLVGMLIYTSSQSSQLAFLCGALGWLVLMMVPRSLKFMSTLMAAGFLAFPFLVPWIAKVSQGSRTELGLPESAEHRIQLWLGFFDPIVNQFLIGYGAKANRVMALDGVFGEFAEKAGYLGATTHPHNVSLEFWIDYGLIGAVLAALMLIASGLLLAKLSKTVGLISMVMLITGLSFSFSGAGFTQAWWLASMCMSAAAMIACRLSLETDRTKS